MIKDNVFYIDKLRKENIENYGDDKKRNLYECSEFELMLYIQMLEHEVIKNIVKNSNN